MTSSISYERINENYPSAGEDNDTQVLRDNFDTVKTSLRIANEEVTDLQDNVVRTDVDNDLNNKIIQRAVLQNTPIKKLDGGMIDVPLVIDYENGSYQIFRFSADTTIEFQNLPDSNTTPSAMGKITLELYSDGSARTLTFITSNGTVIKTSPTFPNPFVVSEAELSAGLGDPIMIEVWGHKSDRIFLNYLGQFS